MNEQRYRQAERGPWEKSGATPVEHRVSVAGGAIRLRVQERRSCFCTAARTRR
jgi:hypothetical protein